MLYCLWISQKFIQNIVFFFFSCISRFRAEYGPDWKRLSEVLGKHRVHVKDAWRRIRLPNRKKGRYAYWSWSVVFACTDMLTSETFLCFSWESLFLPVSMCVRNALSCWLLERLRTRVFFIVCYFYRNY